MKKILPLLSFLCLALVATAQWSVENLSTGRYQHAAASAGNIAIFAGGLINSNATMSSLSAVADIYNHTTGTWSTAQLSVPRTDLSAASAGDKILFAGGRPDYTFPYNFSPQVDIYNTTTGTWTTALLSNPRYQMTAVSAGTKCFFAGGNYFQGFNQVPSDTVDIYDAVTNTWTVSHLPTARSIAAGAYANGKVYIAGGQTASGNGNTVDIYDIASGTWTSIPFPNPRRWLNGGSIGNLVFFAGGDVTQSSANYIDIYNTVTGQWSVKTMTAAKQYIEIASLGNKIYFAGGADAGYFPKKTTDIYDITTNTWTTYNLSVARSRHAAVSVGNRIMFGGGSPIVQGGLPQTSVDVFTDATVGVSEANHSFSTITVFPNPASSILKINSVWQMEGISIFDVYGKLIYTSGLKDSQFDLDVTNFENGIYFLQTSCKSPKENRLISKFAVQH